MPDVSGRRMAFIDFDGVICDSQTECFVSSARAYYSEYRGNTGPAPGSREESDFRRLRPFVRTGGDYLFVQACVEKGEPVRTQEEFDAVVAADPAMAARYHTLFYRERSRLLAEEPDYWFSLNPLYSGMADMLGRLGDDQDVFILSTKEPAFIGRILEFHGVHWDASRILCSGAGRKRSLIGTMLDGRRIDTAIFIDDQPDHFRGKDGLDIQCFLAGWGYVLPEWLKDDSYTTITPVEAGRLLGAW